MGSYAGNPCFQFAEAIQARSHRDQLRAKIVKGIIALVDTMTIDVPFATFDHSNPFHKSNAAALLGRIKPVGYHWIAMAYCLAIEHDDNPPAYVESC